MIDIQTIRFISQNAKEMTKLRQEVTKAINEAANNGLWIASIIYDTGLQEVYSERTVKQLADELRKDGFNCSLDVNAVHHLKIFKIDWVEQYADTDSVKLPESCPEVAPELPQVCQNCKWFLPGDKKCQLKGYKIIGDPACVGCGLYESED